MLWVWNHRRWIGQILSLMLRIPPVQSGTNEFSLLTNSENENSNRGLGSLDRNVPLKVFPLKKLFRMIQTGFLIPRSMIELEFITVAHICQVTILSIRSQGTIPRKGQWTYIISYVVYIHIIKSQYLGISSLRAVPSGTGSNIIENILFESAI